MEHRVGGVVGGLDHTLGIDDYHSNRSIVEEVFQVGGIIGAGRRLIREAVPRGGDEGLVPAAFDSVLCGLDQVVGELIWIGVAIR